MKSRDDVRRSLSRKILASVLVDAGAIIAVIDVIGRRADIFPSPDDKLFAAILSCIDGGETPTVELVANRSGLDMRYVGAIASAWTDTDNRNLLQNAGQLKQYSTLDTVRHIGADLMAIDSPDDIIPTVAAKTVELSSIGAVQSDRDPSATAVSDAAWERVNSFDPNDIIPTGMEWFDRKAAGLWGGMMYWIVGAYKSGKSTLMRNIVMSAVSTGAPVDVFVAEGSRQMFALSMQMMIATDWLYQNQNATSRFILSPLFVMRLWHNNRGVFSSQEQEAIQYARQVWNTMPIRVWDTTDGIRDINTLAWRIRQSRLRYGTRAVFIDYLQLLGAGDTEYQRVSNASRTLQEITQHEDVATVVLAQRNESAINSGSVSHSPGVKGGGDPAATADFLLLPSIDPDDQKTMNVKLHLSRWTSTGGGSHIVNPQSGLIIDKYFK